MQPRIPEAIVIVLGSKKFLGETIPLCEHFERYRTRHRNICDQRSGSGLGQLDSRDWGALVSSAGSGNSCHALRLNARQRRPNIDAYFREIHTHPSNDFDRRINSPSAGLGWYRNWHTAASRGLRSASSSRTRLRMGGGILYPVEGIKRRPNGWN